MIRRALLILSLLTVVLALGLAGTAWWAWRQQTELLMVSANEVLAEYGIEVLSIDGLTTGMQSSRAEHVIFRSQALDGEHSIRGLVIDYDARQLLQGHVQRLQAESVEIRPTHNALPGQPSIILSMLDFQCSSARQCQGNVSLNADISQLSIETESLEAQQLVIEARADIRFASDVVNIDIAPGLSASLGSATTPLLQIEQLSLMLQQALRLTVDLNDNLLIADGGRLLVQAPIIRNLPDNSDASGGLSGLEITLERVNASFDFSTAPDATQLLPWQQRLNAQASLIAEKIYTSLIPFNLWSLRWHQEMVWSPQQVLELNSTARLAERDVLRVNLSQDFNTRQGRATVESDNLDFSPGKLTLTDVLSPLPADADLVAGQLSLQAELGWQIPESLANSILANSIPETSTPGTSKIAPWKIHGTITTQANGLTGFYEDTAFAGLTTTAHWQLAPDMTLGSSEPALLELKELNPGIAMYNLQTRFSYQQQKQQLELRDTRLTLFGGTVSAQPILLNLATRPDPTAIDSEFTIQLDGVDISQLLSLSAYNQVSADGLVDGNLPVSLRGLNPVIAGGSLTARAPGGSIRYDSGAGISGNQSLDLVYQALRHYQYEQMSATVDYRENGELILTMQLQGLSPELNSGQRINLNLNISDNIPALLQSLQAAQNMNERLEDLLN